MAGDADSVSPKALNPVMARLGLHDDQRATRQALAIYKFSRCHSKSLQFIRCMGVQLVAGVILVSAVRVFLIYISLIAGAIGWNLTLGIGPAAWAASFGGGLLLWTLLEYFIHRFAFHRLAPHY